jgi:hypothetical protein
MLRNVLCRLAEHPTCLATASLGNGTVITMVRGLTSRGDETQIACGVIGISKARYVAQSGNYSLGDGNINTGQCHEELYGRIGEPIASELRVQRVELLVDTFKESELTINGRASSGIELKLFEPRQSLLAEEIRGAIEQPLVEHRMQTILDARTIGDERDSTIRETTFRLGVIVGLPDFRQVVDAKELGKDECIDLVSLDLRFGDGACAKRIGHDDFNHSRAEEIDNAPGVGGGFDGDFAIAEIAISKASEGLALTREKRSR